jgi:GNAT superfamily N-acetyltransferase
MSDYFIKPVPAEQFGELFNIIKNDEDPVVSEAIGTPFSNFQFNRQIRLDPDFFTDFNLGLYINNSLAGHAPGGKRSGRNGTTAHLKWIFVKRKFRKQGFGKILLQKFEKVMKEHGVTELVFGSSSPVYLFPGVPSSDKATYGLLKSQNWQLKEDRVSIGAVLEPENAYDKALKLYDIRSENIDIHIASEYELPDIYNFIKLNFSPSWALEIKDAVEDRSSPAFCTVAVDSAAANIAGFAVFHATNPFWFGPMGVKELYRNRGIGRALTLEVLKRAKQLGFSSIMIPWINGKENFYGSMLKNKKWYRLNSFYKKIV